MKDLNEKQIIQEYVSGKSINKIAKENKSAPLTIRRLLVRFAYMRSGTCRMFKLSTNVSVPFLIYAVSTSTVYFV